MPPHVERMIAGRVARGLTFAVVLAGALLGAGGFTRAAAADPATGAVYGTVIAKRTGEPISAAIVILQPADSTKKRTGGMTNTDGTFRVEAPPGVYDLRVLAQSYATQIYHGVTIDAGHPLQFSVELAEQAIQQEAVQVEADAKRSTESALLTKRRKATALTDAVSAEQVKKAPDRDAAEVLRRVTGLSVADGKYVFVRGLGERYSSTQIDGVRIASPEQNKRVVPMDLVPAKLLENIVVQKTYTADLPGEFGGGDIQVETKDFPDVQTWSLSAGQGYASGITGRGRQTYGAYGGDTFGFGAGDRGIPDAVRDVSGGRPLTSSADVTLGFTKSTLSSVARSFEDVWSPHRETAPPNGSYSAMYGNQLSLFGKPLGVIEALSLARGFDERDESQRFFEDTGDTLYDYAVQRYKESVQLGGISGLSYRLSPRHSLHARGLFVNSADDEVRNYEGPDHNRIESTTGEWLVHRASRLLYVQRLLMSGSLEGRHEFPQLENVTVDWKATGSRARQEQPDRRETVYDRRFYDDGTGHLVEYWSLGSLGRREYGDLTERGHGVTLKGALPYRLGSAASGKVQVGFDWQTKNRDNLYRRFDFHPHAGADLTAPPDSIFGPSAFDSTSGTGWVQEATLAIDNYRATSSTMAGFASVDVSLGSRVRGNAGLRREHGRQDVTTYDIFAPEQVVAEGILNDVDWIPAGNVTVSLDQRTNVRLAASRTLSRPDLNELSPRPSLEYVGGFQVAGNPDLQRAKIDNYDLRLETFPSLTELLAVGVFYKGLHQPIEQVIQGGAPPVLVPRNSDRGRNLGVEVEARMTLARVAPALRHFTADANVSFISSEVRLTQLSALGTDRHPLQGQADHLVNGTLNYATADGRADASILIGVVGRRLRALGLSPLPDVYARSTTTLDASVNVSPVKGWRLKFAAKNLLNPLIGELQGGKEVSSYRDGRSFSLAVSCGS